MSTSRLEFAVETARVAGRATLPWFQKPVEIERKADDSPVTIADRHAERLVRDAIERAFPGEPILGEEEGESGQGRDRWVVDPIDGTKSFVAGVPLFATLLSYEVEGQPVLGVAYFPALDEMIFAGVGEGTYWNGTRCAVSKQPAVAKATLATGSLGSMEREGRLQGLLRLAGLGPVLRGWGDAYGHALVATGRVEAMIDPIVAHWDISAMKIIVEEAGGLFSNFDGESGLFREAVSSNGLVHDAVLEAFAP